MVIVRLMFGRLGRDPIRSGRFGRRRCGGVSTVVILAIHTIFFLFAASTNMTLFACTFPGFLGGHGSQPCSMTRHAIPNTITLVGWTIASAICAIGTSSPPAFLSL